MNLLNVDDSISLLYASILYKLQFFLPHSNLLYWNNEFVYSHETVSTVRNLKQQQQKKLDCTLHTNCPWVKQVQRPRHARDLIKDQFRRVCFTSNEQSNCIAFNWWKLQALTHIHTHRHTSIRNCIQFVGFVVSLFRTSTFIARTRTNICFTMTIDSTG